MHSRKIRRLCFIITVGGLAFSASAEDLPSTRIGLDIRFDAEMGRTTWDNKDNGEKNSVSEKFVLTSGRFNLWGKIDPKTTYRVRYEMKGDHTEAGADNITSAINYFYIDHAFTDNVYLRVGKQFVVTSSWEFHYNRSQAYHYSETFLKVPAYYETGAQIGIKFAGQTIGVQLTNSVPETAEKKGRDFTKGIFWYGNVFDKLLQPIVSYAVFPRAPSEVQGQKDELVATTVISVGTKINAAPFDFDIYGGQVSTPNYKSYALDATGNTRVENENMSETWQTLVAYARYKIEQPMIHPFVKVSYDKGKIDSKEHFRFMRYSTGAEWFPSSERFWLHGVYVGQQDKFVEVTDGRKTVQSDNMRRVSKYIFGVGSSF